MTSARHLVHTSRFHLRFADMDALGHVNNAAYFTFMEQARLEWLEKHAPGAYAKRVGPVIANASCTYRTPLVYPKAIEVRMYLGAPGRSSIDSYYEIVADGMIYADGAAKIVWVDLTTGKSTPLPEDIAAPLRTRGKE
ncbi:MAG: thioesterase family protein [Burkholderiales bacterium]